MEEFLNWTAWLIDPPKPYGAFHILFTLLGFTGCWLLAGKLKNTDEKQNNIVLLTVGLFLFLSEIYKQLLYYYVINDRNYAWWIFPFQMCSIPMYFCLALPFIKNVKIKSYLYNFIASFNLMGGFISFFEPSGLLNRYLMLTIHSLLWHMTLVFVGFYIVRSKRAATSFKDFKQAVVVFLILCFMAFNINLLFYDVSNGSINMFFLGPVNSPIIVFKDIARTYGWYVNLPIYILANCLGAEIFYYVLCKINNREIIHKTSGKLRFKKAK
ncbi:MAG TPA: YwaF family protein [Erysipelotrichaceae bacterium]|nr:YwaF family protein [Erysipelotrichaceae bacterium]HQB31793.1 YwaF family protein [Erysipelotrichaceae bacterium]